MPGFVLLVRDRTDSDPKMRVGFTPVVRPTGAGARDVGRAALHQEPHTEEDR